MKLMTVNTTITVLFQSSQERIKIHSNRRSYTTKTSRTCINSIHCQHLPYDQEQQRRHDKNNNKYEYRLRLMLMLTTQLLLLVAIYLTTISIVESFSTIPIYIPLYPSSCCNNDKHKYFGSRTTYFEQKNKKVTSYMAISDDDKNEELQQSLPGIVFQEQYPRQHHIAIKTSNITRSMAFYTLLGYTNIELLFRTGSARACWITTATARKSRLELIEVPSYMLQQQLQQRAPDVIQHPTMLGYNHIAFDVTEHVVHLHEQVFTNDSVPSLQTYVHHLNKTSVERFQKALRMVPLTQPSGIRTYASTSAVLSSTTNTTTQRFNNNYSNYIQQQMIGPYLYEVAFLYDADGSIIELLYCTGSIVSPVHGTQQHFASGWEPWNSTTFIT